MIKIYVDNKKYKLPTEMHEITIEQYSKLKSIDKDDLSLNKVAKYFAIILDIPLDIIKDIKIKYLKMAADKLSFFNDNSYNNVRYIIKHQGVMYGLLKDFDNMLHCEWADLYEITKNEKNINNNLHYLMAILYRPIKKFKKEGLIRYILSRIFSFRKHRKLFYELEEYNVETIRKNSKLFKSLTMDNVLNAYFFFSNLNLEYLKKIKTSLEKKLEVVETKN